MNDSLADFTRETFTHDGEARAVYWKGEGPGVVVMSEIPGITPRVADFSRRLVDAGYSVSMPDLFGKAGKAPSQRYIATSFTRSCVAREFVAFATGRTAPITTWLRGLVAETHVRAGVGRGVGVVGMCFTGGFGLALAVDPLVLVPVLSQPSLPLGILGSQKRDVGVSASDLRVVQDRAAAEDLCVIGLRFSEDQLVPDERFARYEELLGEAFIGVTIDSSAGNEHDFRQDAHSVLTEEFSDSEGNPTKAAHDLILKHFAAKLH